VNNLIENSIHGIVAVDASGRVIIFNRSAERIMGYQSSDVAGSREIERFFPRDFSRQIHSALEGKVHLEDLKTVAQETWVRSREDERVPVRFSGVILREEDSAVGAVGFFQDLRPFKVLEREKQHAERLAVVGQTVAALAHGIKNIITGLEGGVYVIQTAMKRQDDALLQKGWGMVERNIEKIANLVKDLLSYSKVAVTEIQSTNPNELAEEVNGLFEDKARQAGIELLLDLDPGMDEATMDPKAVHTCLANLMSNGIDACIDDEAEKHHRVVMRTRREEDGSVTFEVEDNGTGMDEEVRDRLFANFFSTKGTKGTGLGLMVTHKLVIEHGGSISVDTRQGQGSCFRITIPQEESDMPPQALSSAT
jgi:PAS domain S-box-containing protein